MTQNHLGDIGAVEREFPYRPGWWVILACGAFFAACTALLVDAAQTNTSGVSLFRIIRLDAEEATVFFWILAILGAGFAIGTVALVWHRISFSQRLALTSLGIVLPEDRWSRAERFIAYNDMHALEAEEIRKQRFLHIHHDGGKHTIATILLPSKAVFEEVCEQLARRLQ